MLFMGNGLFARFVGHGLILPYRHDKFYKVSEEKIYQAYIVEINTGHELVPMPRALVRCLVDAAISEGQQRNVACLFHRCSHQALVLGAGTGLAARAQVAIFCHILAQKVDFFVVNGQGFVGAELAELGFRKEFAISAFPTTAFAA